MKIYQLNDHIPRIHQGKQTRCNNCQKKFSTEEFLQIHQKKYCHQQLQYNTTGMSMGPIIYFIKGMSPSRHKRRFFI